MKDFTADNGTTTVPAQPPAGGEGTAVSRPAAATEAIAKVSHEIRTPLNVVLGLTNILQSPNIPPHKQKEFLKTLQGSAQQLVELVDNLLTGIQAQAHVLDLERVSFATTSAAAPVFEQEDKKASRILLVEDFEPNALVATSYLKLFGYSCDVATNGREALEMLEKGGYDAVLMDVQMPEMDGYEAAMFIREQEAIRGTPRMPIIGMTAYALSGDREKCLLNGMDNYISKPFNAAELKAVLKNYTTLPARPAAN